MQHFLKDNLGLVYKLGNSEENSVSAMVSKNIIDFRSWSRPGMQGGDYIAPLYVYPESQGIFAGDNAETPKRIPNLDMEIIQKIAEKIGLEFVAEKNLVKVQNLDKVAAANEEIFAPIDLLDYIYAVLHSPNYREKYKEFLKIDFPRAPYPENANTFWKLVKLGGKIRQIHLLESETVNQFITKYPVDGDNVVEKPKFEINYDVVKGETTTLLDPVYPMGRVYINDTQYFEMVPEIAWNFYIGGYQPAQKWLKDRKGRTLNFEDLMHYQKIIVALFETDRLMKEIDEFIN